MFDFTIYPPSPLVWVLICTVAIVAIYYTWVRKLGSKPKEETAPNPGPNPTENP